MGDRNFDDLAHRFARNVNDSAKGTIRRGVILRDFNEFLPSVTADGREHWALDVGGGQGQVAIDLARRGYRVILCDLSVEMLKAAETAIDDAGLHGSVELVHTPIQSFLTNNQRIFDVIACHAVLEWVEDNAQLFKDLVITLNPGGYLSLLYYNLNGLIFKNLLRTNFKKIKKQDWRGGKRSLTPTYPLTPAMIAEWESGLPLQRLCESGVRVFHDYIFDSDDRERDPDSLIELELHYSRQMPFVHMARYIHVLWRKNPSG